MLERYVKTFFVCMFRGAVGTVSDEDCFCPLPPRRIHERKENTFFVRKTHFFNMYVPGDAPHRARFSTCTYLVLVKISWLHSAGLAASSR